MQETRLIDSPNPTHSHFTKYRFDNPTHEQSPPTSRFADRNGVMKILVGFSGVILCILLFVGSLGQVCWVDRTSFD